MKKHLLRLTAVIILSGLFTGCVEEEILPQDELNSTEKNEGVTEEDGTF